MKTGIMIVALAMALAGCVSGPKVDNAPVAALDRIISRTSGLSETAKSELLAEARRRGYDTDKLIWVEQK